MIKIKFFSNYEQSKNLLHRFKHNYQIENDPFEYTLGEDYDYAVVYNRTDDVVRVDALTITVIQEPSWNEAHDVKTYLKNSDYILIHDPELFERTHQLKLGGHVIESPAYLFYHDHVDHSFFDGAETFKKSRKLSMIVSSLYRSRANYRKRIGVLEQILASDLDIDIFGRGLDIPDPRNKGELRYKHNGLLPYEYSIAIENSNEKNYVTEKFVDCALCSTIPIYNGAPNVADIYDARYFKTIVLESPTIVDDIKNIIAEPASLSTVNKNLYHQRYNLHTKLVEIVFGKA